MLRHFKRHGIREDKGRYDTNGMEWNVTGEKLNALHNKKYT